MYYAYLFVVFIFIFVFFRIFAPEYITTSYNNEI